MAGCSSTSWTRPPESHDPQITSVTLRVVPYRNPGVTVFTTLICAACKGMPKVKP